MKVKDILLRKGKVVHTIPPGITVFEALKLMAEKNIGALPVIQGNELVGIFTERDYARKVILKGKFSKDILVGDVMQPHPITVTEEEDIRACMSLMTDKFVRHLPVMSEGKLAGIVSIGDIVKSIITEQEFIIENLSNYISGGRGTV
ncbi:MAG TPA: CBS domain-containing protein [Chitinophagales bacterium]|nr:CBS domain-containing protein [Chitinophagales bacterium]